MIDPTRRFTGRVRDYVRYRPGYPPEVLDLLRRECNLTENSEIADIGSGTGILARLFLDNGNRVVMVEPNDDMRHAGERLLSGYGRLDSVAATAEATGLSESSVDFITVGQAFHWFDPVAAREEFTRVLRPGGRVVLVWNARKKAGRPFLEDYEGLLNAFGTDYSEVEHGKVSSSEAIRDFFAPNEVHSATFDNMQDFDLPGLGGRLRSSSYIPAEGDPGYREMLEELERVFCRHETGGRVIIEYDTGVYFGALAP